MKYISDGIANRFNLFVEQNKIPMPPPTEDVTHYIRECVMNASAKTNAQEFNAPPWADVFTGICHEVAQQFQHLHQHDPHGTVQ